MEGWEKVSVDGNERHEIAEFMRQLAKRGFDFNEYSIGSAIGKDVHDSKACWNRLADLIDSPIMRGVGE